MRATLFVTTGEAQRASPSDRLPSLEGREMLEWRQIEEMSRYGIEIGAHTLTHPDLTRLGNDDVEREILGSRRRLEDFLGKAVDAFCYPFGRYDDRSLAAARAHFRCACTDYLALAGPKSDPHLLERVDAYYLRDRRRFGRLTKAHFRTYLALRNSARLVRRALT